MLRKMFMFLFCLVIGSMLVGPAVAQTQLTEQWVARYGPSPYSLEFPYDLTVDSDDNVYVTGVHFPGTQAWDYGTIKYNSSGEQQWIDHYDGGANSADYATSLAVDSSGNVYVTGYSNIDLDNYSHNITTVKYDIRGEIQWIARYDKPAISVFLCEPYIHACEKAFVALDPSGNVIVAGSCIIKSDTGRDYTIIKYDSNTGQQLWGSGDAGVSKYNGLGNADDIVKAMAIDASGNIYVTGHSWGFNTESDYATVKYDSNGQFKWVARYNGTASINRYDTAKAIALDSYGNVYVTGTSYGTNNDYVTIKYNGVNGEQSWGSGEAGVRRYTGSGHDDANSIAIDSAGNIYVTGNSFGNWDTGDDYLTVKYDVNGNQQWVARYNGPGNEADNAKAISVDTSGNVYVTGVSFGGYIEEGGTNYDMATVVYDSSGNELAKARYNGPGNLDDAACDIAVTSTGVYVTGVSTGTNFDYATIKYSLSALPPTNQPPVADAGLDQTVTDTDGNGTENVTLDGSGSSDPDQSKETLNYAWTWSGGSATGMNPTVSLPVGTTTITLTVTDNEGVTRTDTVIIEVKPNTPVPPPGEPTIVVLESTAISATITFNNVTGAGNTTMTVIPSDERREMQSGFKLLGNLCFDIETTATYSGTIKICITYDDTGLSEGKEKNIKLQHWEGNGWADITILPVDTVGNVICGETTGFSDFAVVILEMPQGPLPVGEEFRVNATTTGNQYGPSIAKDPIGNYVVAWFGSDRNIIAQRYNADGSMVESELNVASNATGGMFISSHYVAMGADGKFVIAWLGSLPNQWPDIYAQRFNADGTKAGSVFKVNTFAVNTSNAQVSIAGGPAGDFVIAWDGIASDQHKDVYAQIYNADGTKKGSEFKANTYTFYHQARPSVAIDAIGNIVIVWDGFISGIPTPDGDGIIAQRFNANGEKIGSEFLVNSTTSNLQYCANIAMAADGRFVITWVSRSQDYGNGYGIYAQRFNADGTKDGPEFLVNTTTQDDQTEPSISMDGYGNFVISWKSGPQYGDTDIYAQRFNADGTKDGPEFRVNTYITGIQYTPSVAMVPAKDPTGRFTIAWTSVNQDGDSGGIYAQRYALDLNPPPTNQPPVANAGQDQTKTDTDGNGMESVTLDGSGSYDPDGTIASYLWTWNGGSASGPNPTISLPIGITEITLTVTDDKGATGTDTVTITVNPNTPVSPPGEPTVVVLESNTITFDNVTEAGSTKVTSVESSNQQPPPGANFMLLDNDMYFDITTTAAYSGEIEVCLTYDDTNLTSWQEEFAIDLYHNVSEGIWEIITTFRDTEGNVICGRTSSLSHFAVFLKLFKPTAVIVGPSAPVYDNTSPLGVEEVQLDGTSSDLDGTIVSYEWKEGATIISNVASPTFALSVGQHDLTLTVTDNDGLTDTASISITVNPAQVEVIMQLVIADVSTVDSKNAAGLTAKLLSALDAYVNVKGKDYNAAINKLNAFINACNADSLLSIEDRERLVGKANFLIEVIRSKI